MTAAADNAGPEWAEGEITAAKVRERYGDAGLAALTAKMKGEAARLRSLAENDGPLGLACSLNPNMRRTPALEVLSVEMERAISQPGTRLIISVSPQEGKALDTSTEVLTTAGWSTMGDLQVGDEVFHPDGYPTRVTEAHPVRHDHQCYRVTTTDGRTLIADGEHLWTVRDRSRRGGGSGGNSPAPWETVTTEQLVARGVVQEQGSRPNGQPKRAYRFSIPQQHTITSKPVDLPIDPYVLGAWLGDGNTNGAFFTSADEEIVDHIRATGLTVTKRPDAYGWYISRQEAHDAAKVRARVLCAEGVPQREACRRVGLPVGTPLGVITENHGNRWMPDPSKHVQRIKSFRVDLAELGVLGNKHVPEAYLTAGTEQRLALLQGLMDTDGTMSNNGRSSRASFTSCKRELAEGVLYLARSLGWRTTVSEGVAKLNGREVGPKWTVGFTPQQGEMMPFRLTRKVERVQAPQSRAGERHVVSIASIEPVESRPVRCIRVEREDGLFLAGRGLMATHNTTLVRHALLRKLQMHPDRRNAIASYAVDLAQTSGRAIRQMIDSHGSAAKDPATGTPLPDKLGIAIREDHAAAGDWALAGGREGSVYAIGVGGGLTGRPVDGLLVIDDPVKDREQADSPTYRERVWDWLTAVAETRLGPEASVVLIMTRWHEDDVAGRLQANDEALPEEEREWRVVNIPALAQPGLQDSLEGVPGARSDDGWLVSARQRTPEMWAKIRRRVGERVFSALYQGAPTPVEGGIFKREWFDNSRVQVAPPLPTIIIGVDPAETGTGDEAGIIVAGVAEDAQLYILADLSGQLSQGQWARRICIGVLRYDANRVLAERTLGLNTAITDAWHIVLRQARALDQAYEDGEENPITAASQALHDAGDHDAADPVQLRELDPIRDKVSGMPSTGPRVVVITPRTSKRNRAEAATSWFEFGRAHIVGRLPILEHQAASWQENMKSPNRLDVLAHVLNHLEKARAKATVTRRPRHLQAVPTTTVLPLAR